MFNPVKFDDRMLRLHGKLAEYWQNKTGTDKMLLARAMYGASFAAQSTYATGSVMLTLGMFLTGVACVAPRTQTSTGRLPFDSTVKGAFMLSYIAAAAILPIGLVHIYQAYKTGSSENAMIGMETIKTSVMGLSLMGGVYVERTPLDPPPKKKPLAERIKESFSSLFPKPEHPTTCDLIEGSFC
jgi:hypothetical protein